MTTVTVTVSVSDFLLKARAVAAHACNRVQLCFSRCTLFRAFALHTCTYCIHIRSLLLKEEREKEKHSKQEREGGREGERTREDAALSLSHLISSHDHPPHSSSQRTGRVREQRGKRQESVYVLCKSKSKSCACSPPACLRVSMGRGIRWGSSSDGGVRVKSRKEREQA